MQIQILPDAGDGIHDVVLQPENNEEMFAVGEAVHTTDYYGDQVICMDEPGYWDKQVSAFVFPCPSIKRALMLTTKLKQFVFGNMF